MLWSRFVFSQGAGNLVRTRDVSTSMKYQQILNKNLAVSAKKLQLGHDGMFHLDNDVPLPMP